MPEEVIKITISRLTDNIESGKSDQSLLRHCNLDLDLSLAEVVQTAGVCSF